MTTIPLSEFIVANVESILREWEIFAKTIPAASNMDTSALRDHAAAILAEIARDMATDQSCVEQQRKSEGKKASTSDGSETRDSQSHGRDRFDSGFHLDEMVSEYRALRATVIRLWTRNGDLLDRDGVAQLTRFNEGLDEAITASIAHYGVLRQRDMEMVARRKDEFLAILAHELRNPLAPLRNAVSWVRGNLDADGRQAVLPVKILEMIERQIAQMARLLDDLLDAARIARGTLEMRREVVHIASIVNAAVEATVMPPTSHVSIALPNEPLYIDADAARLVQAVSNLLNNAVKFSREATPIELRVERAGHDIELTVKDKGIGIPVNKLEDIFGMFSQLDRTLERSNTGLGIGLTLVRQIVELHGGTIRASSDGLGLGSVFVMRLPESSPPAVAEHTPSTGHALGRKNILIVDDNRDAADSMGLLLSAAGHDVHLVYEGPKALGAAIEFKPDIILLDIGMPVMDGNEVARKVRQHNWFRRPTLIAVTGWGQPEDRQRSKEAGFDFHLVKPVASDALNKLVCDIDSRLSRDRSQA